MTTPNKQEQSAAQLAPLLKAWLEEMQTPMYADKQRLIAMDRFAKFKAHVQAGFSEAHALELCSK